MSEIDRHGNEKNKQAYMDLEKATHSITQALQLEAESNRQMKMKFDDLQKILGEKESSLFLAIQTTACLQIEMRNLQLQSEHGVFEEGNQCLPEDEIKTEMSETNHKKHTQACMDLEKATHSITQALQLESESNRQMKINLDVLQKSLEEKDSSLFLAMQTTACLLIELKNLQLQNENSMSEEGNQYLPGDEIKTEKKEESDDAVSPADVIQIKTEPDDADDGSGDIIKTVLMSSDGEILMQVPINEDTRGTGSWPGRRRSSNPHWGSSSSSLSTPRPGKLLKRFPCPDCGKRYRFRWDLIVHQKRLHKQSSRPRSPTDSTPCDQPASLLSSLASGLFSAPPMVNLTSAPQISNQISSSRPHGAQASNQISSSRPHGAQASNHSSASKSSTSSLSSNQIPASQTGSSSSSSNQILSSSKQKQKRRKKELKGPPRDGYGGDYNNNYSRFRAPWQPRRQRQPSAYFRLRREAEYQMRKYPCQQCSRFFYVEQLLHEHVKKAHNPSVNPKKFACGVCQVKFLTAELRVIHERTVHPGTLTFPCRPGCGESFSEQYDLAVHQLRHKAKKERKLSQCPTCGLWFASLKDLRTHSKTHPETTHPTASAAQNSVNTQKKVNIYQCMTCHQWFTCLNYLLAHCKTHSERERAATAPATGANPDMVIYVGDCIEVGSTEEVGNAK